MGDKPIPDEASLSLQSFYPPENILYNEDRRSATDLNKDKGLSNKGKMDDNACKMAEAEAETNNENKSAETDTVKTA